jgi:uncharacterized membrane protein YciS (DUF1049 family)
MNKNSRLLADSVDDEMKYPQAEEEIKNPSMGNQESELEKKEDSKPKNCCEYLYGCLGQYSVRILAGVTSVGALTALGMAIFIGSEHSEGYVPWDNTSEAIGALNAMNGQTNIRLNSLIAGVIAGSLGMAGLMFTTFHLHWKSQYKLLEKRCAKLENTIKETSEKSPSEEYKGGIAYDLNTLGAIQSRNNNQQLNIQQPVINSSLSS